MSTFNQIFDDLRNAQSSNIEDDITVPLIDPYLYPLIYNRSLAPDPENAALKRPVEAPPKTDAYTKSSLFALLPADFVVSPSGSVRFTSYINNLEPWRAQHYDTLETILAAFIPLFEHSLTDLHRHNPLPQRIKGSCRYTEWEEPDPPEHSDDEGGWATYEREMRHWIMQRPIHLPDVPECGYTGGLEHRKRTVSLRGTNLQVIVDLHDTELVSVSWHVLRLPVMCLSRRVQVALPTPDLLGMSRVHGTRG